MTSNHRRPHDQSKETKKIIRDLIRHGKVTNIRDLDEKDDEIEFPMKKEEDDEPRKSD